MVEANSYISLHELISKRARLDALDLSCPICHKPIKHPVMASDNHTYCKVCIQSHLQVSNISPMTDRTLTETIRPNSLAQALIESVKKQKEALDLQIDEETKKMKTIKKTCFKWYDKLNEEQKKIVGSKDWDLKSESDKYKLLQVKASETLFQFLGGEFKAYLSQLTQEERLEKEEKAEGKNGDSSKVSMENYWIREKQKHKTWIVGYLFTSDLKKN